MCHVSPNNWPSKVQWTRTICPVTPNNKWTQLVCHATIFYFSMFHMLRPYKMDDVDFFKVKYNNFEILKECCHLVAHHLLLR
jgi:hypothetical protein